MLDLLPEMDGKSLFFLFWFLCDGQCGEFFYFGAWVFFRDVEDCCLSVNKSAESLNLSV